MSATIPDGWGECSLRECVDVLDNERVPINSKERAKRVGRVPYYGATGQVGWIDDYLFDEELLLLGEDGAPFLDKSKPIAYIVNGKSWINNHAHVLRAKSAKTSNKYLQYYLNSFDFADFVNGTTRLKLTQGAMNRIPVLLAPIPEQQRIVSKLEEVFGKVEACQSRLAKVSLLLTRFRQSVLAAACSGWLTEDWREEMATVDSGSILLQRIRQWRIEHAEDPKSRSQALAEIEGDPEEQSRDGDIPDTWAACHVGDIGRVSNGSTPSRKVASFWGGAIPWVSSGEVANNAITETRERITQRGYDNSSVRMLPSGTVLLAMIGEGKTRGQTSILQLAATINQNVAAVHLEHGMVEPRFLWYWFQRRYESTRERGSGSGPQALNCQRVRELPFVLPPREEQVEICRQVENHLFQLVALELRAKAAARSVEKLSPSVLSKAFRGELLSSSAAAKG